jgi:hypothetical protein
MGLRQHAALIRPNLPNPMPSCKIHIRSTDERIPVTPREAAQYRVLRLIEEQPEISQRELARALGISLG